MTSPDDSSAPRSPQEPDAYAERCYRSPSGIATGVLLLGLAAWLGGDAIARGADRTPWLALAGLLCAVPLIIAFTVRPAVWAGADRLLVRNPFRTITLPWSRVDGVRAGYSSEVLADGAKYQLWSIPVSLRKRKAAARRQNQAVAEGISGASVTAAGTDQGVKAPSDQVMDDLRELAERNAGREGAQGAVTVRWAYEVIAPAVVGFVLLVVLFATG
ncbi:membrane protein [Streptomyces albireticuli]|uniref:Membrane protein n=1 Tax=Streptomyces albireticuli TaxID=1940 RepID=A0A1Z2L1R4_9ACTN|nr:PH domain-containing protein [Streptomyces albireticuli]ARZ68233.1 membrane protein [Streptomyces albireticuli]